jgi:hypothetical protein
MSASLFQLDLILRDRRNMHVSLRSRYTKQAQKDEIDKLQQPGITDGASDDARRLIGSISAEDPSMRNFYRHENDNMLDVDVMPGDDEAEYVNHNDDEWATLGENDAIMGLGDAGDARDDSGTIDSRKVNSSHKRTNQIRDIPFGPQEPGNGPDAPQARRHSAKSQQLA